MISITLNIGKLYHTLESNRTLEFMIVNGYLDAKFRKHSLKVLMAGDKFGYKLGSTPIITTPFADDFNTITKNKIQHQKLISDIENKPESMGLIFQPTKCKSLSIVSGKLSEVISNQPISISTNLFQYQH